MSFTLVQKSSGTNASSTSCTVTMTNPTTAGNLLLIAAGMSSTSGSISSTTGEVATLPSGTHVGSQSPAGGTDVCYVLSAAGGVTNIVINFNASLSSMCAVYEYSFTGSSVQYDTSGVVANGSASLNPPGVALTLGGTNDVIVQVLKSAQNVSSIATYTDILTNTTRGAADLINTTSGTAPTWTLASSGKACGSAIAIKEISGGGTTIHSFPALGVGL